jgi:hypothetical protein
MKKRSITILFISAALIFGYSCDKPNPLDGCFKGRLEVQGDCMNYTIKLLEGNIDSNLIETSWIDEHTSKTYQNVFKLANTCSFPENITLGDEFYFTILKDKNNDCVVCERLPHAK